MTTTFAALSILKESGGEMAAADLKERIAKRVQFDDWALETYASGAIRWRSMLSFYSIDLVKSGFLIKRKGVWILTPEGEKALAKGEQGFFKAATEGYRHWKSNQTPTEPEIAQEVGESSEEIESRAAEMKLDEIEALALDGFKSHIEALGPYEFQDLAAALLRGMGYYTPFIAPRGKDGGMDIVAYRDPLGTMAPRIKIQIKHRLSNAASVPEIRQLMGILQKDGDVGIFISSGGFTSDAKSAARGANVHVELIDLERFIDLWREFYHKLTDEDKSRLPLLPIYFLAPQKI
ncbi:MAG TPA: restriction endonuclease [Abditibacterium sp.]